MVYFYDQSALDNVAPLVGAWIESLFCQRILINKSVAPLVGAWIESLRYLRLE